jgi:D-sedoheptulose 7-phosphate isomerase
MSTVAPVETMNMKARTGQFTGVLDNAQLTDGGGARLEVEAGMRAMLEAVKALRAAGGSLYIIGNGGSAAVASHAVTDFVNVAKLRATTIHDSSLLTCMANDYGYEAAFARILSTMVRPADMLIAISSSGRSRNITNAVTAVREAGGKAITLSGFEPGNALRSLGHFNIWLDSKDYGFVEIGHQFFLHNLADRLRVGL